MGDGDELGVDLAIAKLNRTVTGVYPARLPSENDDPLGLRAVLVGFGTLVEGDSGAQDGSNDQRVGGENIIDRSVAKVTKLGVPDDQLGGVLGIDFDSPQLQHNVLASAILWNYLARGIVWRLLYLLRPVLQLVTVVDQLLYEPKVPGEFME